MARRTLRDLYVVGQEYEFDDGQGPVSVWIQKLNPVDHGHAVTKANAARARVLSVTKDPESDDYFAILNGILDFDKPRLVELLCAVESVRIGPHKRAEIASQDEWKDDNYLDGLEQIWNDEIRERFMEDPEDAEAKRIHDELQRFIAKVDEAVEDAVAIHRSGLEAMSMNEVQKLGIDYEVKNTADMAWIQVYHKWEIFYGVRDVLNHKKRLFEDVSEIDELNGDLINEISAAFRRLTVEPTEGKDSAVSPPSSTSSEQSEAVATEASSGPKAA
jgi:hypothetical protein